MMVDDSFNYHTRLITNYLALYSTIYHQLSCSLGMFKSEMKVDVNFCPLSEQITVNNSFSVSSFAKNGLKQ